MWAQLWPSAPCGFPFLAGALSALTLLLARVLGQFVVQSLSRIQLFSTPWTAACRLSCASPFPGICSNACPLSQCHPTISSSVVPFSSCPQSVPASGSFPWNWLFTSGGRLFASGGQNIGASASASVLPNEYSGLISLRTDWFDLLAKTSLHYSIPFLG